MLLGLLLLLHTASFADTVNYNYDSNVEISVKATSATPKQYEKISRSIVEVRRKNSYSYGTGTLFERKKEIFVLTAAHVIEGSEEAVIKYGDVEIIGKIVYYDEDSDIAVISVASLENRSPLKARFRKKMLSMGESTLYCGFPNKKELACFSGTISLVSSSIINIHSYAWMGASGASVIDKKGKIIGILSAVEVGIVWGFPQLIEDVVWVKPLDSKFFNALDKGFAE
tara:strand:+ start:29808 stop:30488 length:681 start_codon:yes stop_codon:yes gene_type:complete